MLPEKRGITCEVRGQKLGIKINKVWNKIYKNNNYKYYCGPLDDHGMEIKIRVGGHTNRNCGLSHK